jgi:hypothetical protein
LLPCFADADSRTVRCLRSASTQLTAPWPFSRTDTCSLAVHWIPVGLALHAAQSGPAVAAVAVHQLSELQADALDLENGSVGIVAERTERCASTSARLGSWCRHTGGHCHSGLFHSVHRRSKLAHDRGRWRQALSGRSKRAAAAVGVRPPHFVAVVFCVQTAEPNGK